MRALLMVAAVVIAAVLGRAVLAEEAVFSAAERGSILSHGPWPPVFDPDPSNRLSGNAAAIVWGKELLADTRLSRGDDESCVSCHEPFGAFTDGKPTPRGLQRNTLALANLAGRRWFGWTGGEDTLWGQSILPVLNPLEMNATPAMIAGRVRDNADLRARFAQVTGTDPDTADDTALLVLIAKALAAYQETLISPRTRFDRFRDALAAGDAAGMAAYPPAAKRGLKLFAGRGQCSRCHAGPLFGSAGFAGEWRVPSLRNVAHTAPYTHDGSLAALEDVVRHYSEIDMERLHADGESLIQPLRLTEGETADLVAFLETLSGTPRP